MATVIQSITNTKLKIGDALVSMMEERGAPAVVTRDLIAPPASYGGPITSAKLREVQASSPFKSKYDVAADRETAFEIFQARAQRRTSGAPVGESADGDLLSQTGAGLKGLFEPKGRR